MRCLKILFFGACLSCLALQCDKDNDEPKDVTRLSEEFKSYAYFKEGSWWMYKELSSGNLDSAYITRSEILTDHVNERSGGPEDYEHLSIDMVRRHDKDTVPDTLILEGFPPLRSEDDKGANTLMQTIFSLGVSSNVLLFVPANLDDEINNKHNPEVIWAKDSFEVQGRWYNDAIKTKHPQNENSETNNLIKSDIYAKNVGLIRREFWDGRVKELLRYNVKQ